MRKQRESAWLIEWPSVDGQAVYYGAVLTGLGMTRNHDDAIRFARKKDAETVMRVLRRGAAAVEHISR